MSNVERHVFVIFGATGDLGRTKLLPALWWLLEDEGARSDIAVLGVGSRERTDDQFRSIVRESLERAGAEADQVASWCEDHLSYASTTGPGAYQAIKATVDEIEQRHGLPGNRVFYLALPPTRLGEAIRSIGETGLAAGPGWNRIVVEKPFGVDLESARALNHAIHETFDETDVYRIDHYLGKETVRNLLVFRFANSLFERTWNRDHIESVEITVAEDVGVEGRARYYDESGAVRDMLQNHLTQLLTLVAMEAPVAMLPDAIRSEKVKVLRSLRPISTQAAVFGQYTASDDGPAFSDLDGVRSGSRTPTFVALRVEIGNWRWQGVPFYLRTGKRLPQRRTSILLKFRPPPVCLFHEQCRGHSNLLILTLQPDEGFDLFFDVKAPGDGIPITSIPLSVRYEDYVGDLPGAYHTLLHDIMEGDQTLFVRGDEVEESWRVYQDLLDPDEVLPYAPGTWGPEAAADLFDPDQAGWSEVAVPTVVPNEAPADSPSDTGLRSPTQAAGRPREDSRWRSSTSDPRCSRSSVNSRRTTPGRGGRRTRIDTSPRSASPLSSSSPTSSRGSGGSPRTSLPTPASTVDR